MWAAAYQAGSIGGEGLYNLASIRVPGEVVGLIRVDNDGQHLPGHDSSCPSSNCSLNLGAQHNGPAQMLFISMKKRPCRCAAKAMHVGGVNHIEMHTMRSVHIH